MQKATLSAQQVYDFVQANKYKPSAQSHFQSRCIDGRYKAAPDLPALAIPGADAGQLAVVLAAGRSYGFEVDNKKTLEVLTKLIGEVKKLSCHTDFHSKDVCMGGCGHIKQMKEDPASYNLTAEDIKFVQDSFTQCVHEGAQEVKLEGEHIEGAATVIEGPWGVYPRSEMEINGAVQEVEIFTFHKTLVDERHKALAAALFNDKAVKLMEGQDEDFLYMALSDVTENHLLETAKRLAKGLPMYSVQFDKDGSFKLEESG